ncbi:MAG: rRNA maturation RNase YbeY [Spirochaetes bacterium]|jgi:probable rRNA maturation factor|nr:rRNA maturation RNase YbeY [Spirochaetota bacterium]
MNQALAVVEIFESLSLPFSGIDALCIETDAMRLMDLLDLNNSEITIILCSNAEIQSINSEYRSKDYPTDVISFAYREEAFPGENSDETEYLGDIFLSLEKAKEQATELDQKLSCEVRRLLAHSILHLIGYDHETGEEDAEKMFAKEDELLLSLDNS